MDNFTIVYKKYEAMAVRGMLDNCYTLEEIAMAIFPQVKHFDISCQEVITEVKKILQ